MTLGEIAKEGFWKEGDGNWEAAAEAVAQEIRSAEEVERRHIQAEIYGLNLRISDLQQNEIVKENTALHELLRESRLHNSELRKLVQEAWHYVLFGGRILTYDDWAAQHPILKEP